MKQETHSLPILQGRDAHGDEAEQRRNNNASLNDREASNNRSSTWVTTSSKLEVDYKQGISLYVVNHLLEFGQVLQMGSGTTLNTLVGAILEYQRNRGGDPRPLDLAILTTNLEIAQMAREAARDDPTIFGSTQVIMSGGTLLPALNSLVGKYAAQGVKTDLICPDILLMGVAGISFDPPDGNITYHFEHELSTQESYATRESPLRVVLCDHTKLGRTSRWKAATSVRDLTKATQDCTILSSYPSHESKTLDQEISAVEDQVRKLDLLFESWRKNWDTNQDRTQMRLRLITVKGEVKEEIKLWDDLD